MRVFTSESCLAHDPGPGHPDQPVRLAAVQESLRRVPGIELVEATPAPLEPLLACHDRGYLDRADIPFHYALADAYTVCDAYHCSIISATVRRPEDAIVGDRPLACRVDHHMPANGPARLLRQRGLDAAFGLGRQAGHHRPINLLDPALGKQSTEPAQRRRDPSELHQKVADDELLAV